MQCTNPINLGRTRRSGPFIHEERGLIVPCGKCFACRIKKRREWSLRLYHELEMWNDAQFTTLTYADDSIPGGEGLPSLRKRDLQLFFKRLRRHLPEERNVRYFACGEYGDTTGRPHYHAIIYGLGLLPADREIVVKAWPFCDWSVDSIRDKSFGMVTPESIEYVAGYIHKKFSGIKEFEEYQALGREPVFRIMSQGIGRDYIDKNIDDVKKQMHFTMRGKHISIPRYYIKRHLLDTMSLNEHAQLKEAELVEDYTGVYTSVDSLYEDFNFDLMRSYEENLFIHNKQRDSNLNARSKLKRSKL